VHYLEKANDPTFNYEQFYASLRRGKNSTEFGMRSNYQTTYQEFMAQEQKAMAEDADLYRELAQKGQAWSEDYSDEDLSKLLARVGVVYEQDRRRKIAVIDKTRLAGVQLGFNILDNENRADPLNSRRSKWSLEGIYEWYPLPNSLTYAKFALGFSPRYVREGLSMGTKNANIDEYSFLFSGLWHLGESPFAVQKNIPFIGIGFRFGIMSTQVPTETAEANYTLTAFPSVMAGVKYFLPTGWGLRLMGSYERFSLDQMNNNNSTYVLPTRRQFLDGRVSLGMNKLF
jgi:hypothetical protein